MGADRTGVQHQGCKGEVVAALPPLTLPSRLKTLLHVQMPSMQLPTRTPHPP